MASRKGLAISALIVLAMVTAGFAIMGSGNRAASVASVGAVQPQAAYSLNYHFYDFFNVPFKEYWDLRPPNHYGDRPMNAECFSAEGVAEGSCVPSNPSVPDVASYPYAHWYPFAGSNDPGSTKTIPFIYAPYRMQAAGTSVPGYTLADPVYLPVQNSAEAAGTSLSIDWKMEYVTLAQGNALKNVAGCSFTPSFNDGYYMRSQITVTMDLQESKRLFGVVALTPATAQTWWNTNTNPACGTTGAEEANWQDAIVTLAGSANTPGKFDIYNGYEYYYDPFYTNMTATVAGDGTTTLKIDHLADGTEALLTRMFYWGNAGYLGNTLNSTHRTGWWGMEYPWFDDFQFATTIGASTHDFSLTTSIWYHFQQVADPGPNGLYDKTDDIPFWEWGAWLADYGIFSVKHPQSELNRYPNPPYKYIHATAGSYNYGVNSSYDNIPTTWNLNAGESWTFTFPTGNVNFYDPNLTPAGADPKAGEFVVIQKPLYLLRTLPAPYGSWDESTNTWTVTGPATTGGPPGQPGPDGVPGTSDDRYPIYPYPSIDLQPGPALLRVTTGIDLHPTFGVPGKIFVDGVSRDEWSLTWAKMTPGTHTISFGDVWNLGTPAPQIVDVVAGQTTSVVGLYQAYGWLRVVTNPAVPGTISVDGTFADDWEVWHAVPAGDHTIHFGAVAGFDPPADEVATVTAEQLTTITGNYVANAAAPGPDPGTYGLLRVTTALSNDPNAGAPSAISVNGIVRDEWALTWVKVPPGTYTIHFGGVVNLGTPADQTVTIAAGATQVVVGTFLVHGFLRVDTSPPVPGTIFVNGVSYDDWQVWQSMLPGTYTVSFGDVVGYVTPAPQSAVVAANALTTITGNYVSAALAVPAIILSGPVASLPIASGSGAANAGAGGATSAAMILPTLPSKVED